MPEKLPLPNPLEKNPDFDIERETNLGGVAMVDAQEYREAVEQEEKIITEIENLFAIARDVESAEKLLEQKMREFREVRRLVADKRRNFVEAASEHGNQRYLNELKYPEILG